MRKPKLREIKEAVIALVKGPYTTKFPKVPSEPFKEFRGKTEFHEEDCVGCTACAQVCPVPVIEWEDVIENGKGTRKFVLNRDLCIYCGNCQANCITEKGIMLGNEYELSGFDRGEMKQRIEKELVLCEHCGGVVSTVDHIKWVADKIGPEVFGNPTLMLAALQNITKFKAKQPEPESLSERADRIRILCPRCRRETTLER